MLALALSGELTPQQQAELSRDSEHAFGVACQRLLAPGLLGLLIASILADNMSAASAFMVDSGALFTRGFYDRFIAPRRTDRHYLWAGRISGLVITLAGVLYAMFLVDRVLYSFLLTETLATYFGISLVGGLVWRRANRWGALASLATSLTVNFGWYALNDLRLDAFRPEAFALALVSGGAALVVVSLLTAPEGERARELFDRLDTPVGSEDLSPAMARTRAADAGEQLLLPNLLRLRAAAAGRPFFTAYRTDLRGFAVAWCVVAAMIGIAWLLLQAA